MKQRIIVWGKLALVLAMALPIFRAPGFPDWLTGRPDAQTRLLEAISRDDHASFEDALADGASPIARSDWNALPLNDAASVGRIDMVRRLLALGADVNATDSNGVTPLIMAARSGHVEAIEILIRCGADLSHRDSFHRTALDAAIASECPKAAQVLRLASAASDW